MALKKKIRIFICKYLNIHCFVPKENYKWRTGVQEWWDECKHCGKQCNHNWDQ